VSEEAKPKSIVYLFVAKDSDMIVFESHVEKRIVSGKF